MAKYINRLKYIDHMIRRKATGDLDAFARKNQLSKSALSDIINEMKGMGFPIKYDRTRKTYYYSEEGEMIQSLFLKYGQVLSREQIADMKHLDKLCFSPQAVFEYCKEN